MLSEGPAVLQYLADAYLTWALTLGQKIGVKLDELTALNTYLKSMHARAAVQAALAAESAAAQAGG